MTKGAMGSCRGVPEGKGVGTLGGKAMGVGSHTLGGVALGTGKGVVQGREAWSVATGTVVGGAMAGSWWVSFHLAKTAQRLLIASSCESQAKDGASVRAHKRKLVAWMMRSAGVTVG